MNCVKTFLSRYNEDDFSQFAPRDPWADLSTKHSTMPSNSMMPRTAGGNNSVCLSFASLCMHSVCNIGTQGVK